MGASVRIADSSEILGWYQAGEVVLVDVREPDEYAAEAIPGAVNLPLSTFDPARMPSAAGKTLVLHCRIGIRCGKAAERLLAAGWSEPLVRMDGGILAWKAAGGPVTPKA